MVHRVFTVLLFLILMGISSTNAQCDSPEMSSALQPYVERGEMPGFVSVLASTDKILQVDCVGYADVEQKTPITADSLFWIASTTKIFTSTAIMSLVDEGKLSLDDPVEKYIPEFSQLKVIESRTPDGGLVLRAPKTKPTIRQILCHVTGWTFLSPLQARYGIDSLPPFKAAITFAHTPLEADPGQRYNYSQQGIDTAGAVIEAVTGKPYHQFMQERFFDPLGMTSTTFWPSAEALKNLAKSYRVEAGKLKEVNVSVLSYPLDDRTNRFAEPGGGLFSTPNDLVKFFQMLANKGVYNGKRYVSEAAVMEIGKKQTPDNLPNNYGLCSFINGNGWFGHGGAHGNDCIINPDEGLVALYMVQVAGCPQQGQAKRTWTDASKKFFFDKTNR